MITAHAIFVTEWKTVRNILLSNKDNSLKHSVTYDLITRIISYLFQKFGELFMLDYDCLLIEYPVINNILFDSNYITQEAPYNLVYDLELLIHDLIINFIHNNPYYF